MRLIVTRPDREAQRWVHDLSELGLDAVALPLIQVGPVADTTHVDQAWHRLADYVGVMFVSGNAVDYFFKSKQAVVPVFNGDSTTKTRAWSPGPGTAHALLRAGVAPEWLDTPPLDAGQFDSEALWKVVHVQVQPGSRVLVVRGAEASGSEGQGSGREWFASRVKQASGQVDFVVAYERSAPEFTAAERDLARQAASDGSVWLFSSSEAVINLCAALPAQSWVNAHALATHPRIALAAKNAGFGVVKESRPTFSDVVATLNQRGATEV